MKIAITGGAGFIGSHIADRMLADGHEVLVIDSLAHGVNYTPKGADFEKRDLRDLEVEDASLRDVSYVIHAAAYADLRANWNDIAERDRLTSHNITATQALLEAINPQSIVVMLGTASVYGSYPGRVMLEELATPETIESPYAATKFAAEALVAAYGYKRDVPWYVARLVNVVGERYHHGVLRDFVEMAKSGTIHAKDDGVQRKSFVHVRDVADAIAALVRGKKTTSTAQGYENVRLTTIPDPGVYNITSGERWSWRDTIEVMGSPRFTFEHLAKGAVGDPLDLHCSGRKLSKWYQCERSIAAGVREGLEWLGWDCDTCAPRSAT